MNIEGMTISSPYVCDNLTVFLVTAPVSGAETSFLTLEEAMEHKLLTVYETQSVGELEVENLSNSFDVFIQSGDIVKGGLQDRVLAFDMVVPAKSGRMPIKAFCVEQGRWHGRHNEAQSAFTSSRDRVHSRSARLAVNRSSQREVWDQVFCAQEDLSAQFGDDVRAIESPTSLQLTLENEKIEARVKKYVDVLSEIVYHHPENEHRSTVGCAGAINGQICDAEVYSSKDLFRKLWPKLLKASAVQAVSDFDGEAEFANAQVDDVAAFLSDITKVTETQQPVTDRIRVATRETDRTFYRETQDAAVDWNWIHRSWINKLADTRSGSRRPW